jgi:uncharacterized radical SAM superfamily protein
VGGGGALIQTKSRQPIKDLDALPFPDYSGFEFDKLLNSTAGILGVNGKGVASICTSRSCPFRCTFCFHSSGNTFRQRKLDEVFKEVDYLTKIYQVKFLNIVDESFCSNGDRLKEFCRRIKPYDIRWFAQCRVTDFTEEIAVLLKSSNCAVLSFGIESADNNILRSMKKGITIEDTEKALGLASKIGIQVVGALIFGDVEETIITAKNTLQWWKKNMRHDILLNFITTYPGTDLYNYAVSNGIITDEVQFIKDQCPAVNVSKMNNEEVKWLAGQILKLSKTRIRWNIDMTSVYINHSNCTMTFESTCDVCGNKNYFKDVQPFLRNVILCEWCGKGWYIPFIDDFKNNLDMNIAILLNKHKKIAFWGMTEYFLKVAETLNAISNSSVFFIDGSSFKQNVVVNNKKIFDPKILEHEHIPAVIIPALSYFNIIKSEIIKDFTFVKHIINILDLFSTGKNGY